MIKASLDAPFVTKFLLVSYLASRRNRAPWWDDEDWASAQKVNNEILPTYYKAKVEADEYLTALAHKRNTEDPKFQSICLRPGTLSDGQPTGKIHLGKTRSRGKIDRADVAATAVSVLARDDTRGWMDQLAGEDDIDQAVSEFAQSGLDCVEGEDLDRIYATYT